MRAVVYKGAFDVAVETVDQRVDGWTKVLLKPGLQAA